MHRWRMTHAGWRQELHSCTVFVQEMDETGLAAQVPSCPDSGVIGRLSIHSSTNCVTPRRMTDPRRGRMDAVKARAASQCPRSVGTFSMVRRRLRPRHPASQRHRSAGRRKRRQTKPNQNQRKVRCRLDLNHRRTARRVVNEADPRRVVRFPTTRATIRSTRSRRQMSQAREMSAGWLTGFEPAISRSTIWCLNR